jgi:hypothetical protein
LPIRKVEVFARADRTRASRRVLFIEDLVPLRTDRLRLRAVE